MPKWFKIKPKFRILEETLIIPKANLWKHLSYFPHDYIGKPYVIVEFRIYNDITRKTETYQLKGTKRRDKTIVFIRIRPKPTNQMLTYIRETFKNANKQLLEEKRRNYEKSLLRLIKPYITEDYEIETKTKNEIEAKYIDAYEFEQINLEIADINEYGVKTYELWIEHADLENNEIITSIRINNEELTCCQNCEKLENCYELCQKAESELEEIDKLAEKEIEDWKNKKSIEINWLTEKLEISTTITTLTYHIDFTHERYYKGVTIYVKTTDKNLIKNVLRSREIIREIYQAILEDW